MSRTRAIVVSGCPLVSPSENSPAAVGREIARFLNADILSPVHQEHRRDGLREALVPAAPDFMPSSRSTEALIEVVVSRMTQGGDVIFTEPEIAAASFAALKGRGEENRRTSVVLAPLDGNLVRLDCLAKPGRIEHVERLITFTLHQHLYAVERLRLPARMVEMIPPVVDTAYFTNRQGSRQSDMVVLVGSAAHKLSRHLGKGVYILPEITGPAEARDVYQRAAVVVIAAGTRESTSGLESFLRAAACGAPLVVPQTFTLQQLATDREDSFLYSPGDWAGAVQATRRFLGNPELGIAFGSRACSRITQACSYGHLGGRLAAVLRNAATPRQRKAPVFYLILNQAAVV